MKYALVNPPWSFEGSIYFGCREPHLPLEYGYARGLQLDALPSRDIAARVAAFQPDFTVVTTAPSYLFWRCAPPELRIPQKTVRELSGSGGTLVAIGPHASTTPKAALRKLGVDVASGPMRQCRYFPIRGRPITRRNGGCPMTRHGSGRMPFI